MTEDLRAKFDDYIGMWPRMAPEMLHELDRVMHPQVHFTDPFHDFKGNERFKQTLRQGMKMLSEIRFELRHQTLDGTVGLLLWTMHFRVTRGGKPEAILGASEWHYGPDGLITRQIDHWDGQKLPKLRIGVGLAAKAVGLAK